MMSPGQSGMLLVFGGGLTLVAVVYFVVVARRRLIFGPETYFIAMALGTFWSTALTAVADGSLPGFGYATFIGLGTLMFLFGVLAMNLIAGFDHRRELAAFQGRPWRNDLVDAKRAATLTVGCVGIAVVGLYFYELGTFVPWEALRAFLEAGPVAMMDSYTEARGETRGGEYLGLGYVIQFKDCLLPLVALLFVAETGLTGRRASRSWRAVFVIAAVCAAVGTGSRFALASFCALVAVVGLAPYTGAARLSRRQLLVVAALAMVALTALTLMMGPRGEDTPFAGTPLWAPYEVLERVFVAPAQERLRVFEWFLVDEPPQWGGATAEVLRTALPGRDEYTLSNRLHELLYGSPDGNAPLDVWGLLWYDLQWAGLVVAFLLGALYHAFYVRLIRGPKKLIRVIVLAHAGFVLGLASDPQVLLLRGFATLLVFLALVEFVGSPRLFAVGGAEGTGSSSIRA